MNRRLLAALTASVLVFAACGGGSGASPASADASERARALAAATTIEGGKSIFDYSFPSGRANETEPASFGRSR
jgi:ABC-type glycerol-3-phosphate transport system substrate-binding protein